MRTIKAFLLFFLVCFPLQAAEFVIFVGTDPSGTFEDGDIMEVYNDKRIEYVHAQNIVSEYRRQNPSKDTARPEGTIMQDILEKTREYKFERIDTNTVTRTNLWTGDSENINQNPNSKGEYMHVQDFIDYELRNPNHNIFIDAEGMEFWYGGGTRMRAQDITDVWNAIESKTRYLKSNHTKWPASSSLNTKLVIPVTDFTDADARTYLEPLMSEDGLTELKARKRMVNFRTALGFGQTMLNSIEDKRTRVDLRDLVPWNRALIVSEKSS